MQVKAVFKESDFVTNRMKPSGVAKFGYSIEYQGH